MKAALLLAALCITLGITGVPGSPLETKNQSEKVVVCYYGSWATYRPGLGKFDPEHIDPNICTHIMYGFVGLQNGRLWVMDPDNDLDTEPWYKGAMRRFTNLKQQNPNLKALVAIGGWTEGSVKYSEMARTAASRRAFIDSVLEFLPSQNFDGLDLDWEYPANRGGTPEDKQNFVLLINELKEAFQPHGYLLTAAVSAGEATIDTAYDIPGVAAGLDFINVMAYDFHGAGWEPNTGHHSALGHGSRAECGDVNNAKLNAEYAINYWIQGGAPPEKLVLGMGTYGRGWTLQNIDDNGLCAQGAGLLPPGPYTRDNEGGFWGYNEICEKFRDEAGQWTVVRDPDLVSPYAYNGRYWIAYDDVESLTEKVRFALDKGLKGAMIWSIETDDFQGECEPEPYVLIKAVYRALNGDLPPTREPGTTTTRGTGPTQSPTTTTKGPTQPPHEICQEAGFNPDPENPCSQTFYECVANGNGWDVYEKQCGPGTIFNPANKVCDLPTNVPGCGFRK